MTAVFVRGGGPLFSVAACSSTASIVDIRPVDDAPTGTPPGPVGASSVDELSVAIWSAMTLFGRVAIRPVDRLVA